MGAPNAYINGCTLLESGGSFSQHFPHGAKTSAHFFGAKIARSSRRYAVGSRQGVFGARYARRAIGGFI